MEVIKEFLQLSANNKEMYIKNNLMIDKRDISLKELYENVAYDVDLIFSMLQILPNKKGYKYWKDAVFLYLICNEESVSICNYIYANIGLKYDKTSMSIDRAMRLCFENAMYNVSKVKSNEVIEYLKPSLTYPHNGEILAKIVKLLISKDFQKNKNKFFNIQNL